MFVEIDARLSPAEARPAEAGPHSPKTRARRNMERPSAPTAGQPLPPSWYLPCKAACDFLGAVLLTLLAAPVILTAALLVKLTSRGPAIYTQTRSGRDGRPFTIYKLRTMIHNCESLTGPRWAIPDDPRVTRIGRLLRMTHLDELPQLFNVLRGDMSLIGPRPERPELVPELAEAFGRYRERLAVRPGLTGLAQIQLPPDTDLNSVRRKLACDLYYVGHLTPWLDLALLACTALHVLGIPTGFAQHLLRVPTSLAVEQAVPIGVREEVAPRLRKSA